MLKSTLIAGAFAALSFTALATSANAATSVPDLSLLKPAEVQSPVQSVHWTGYWHRHRWGGGGWGGGWNYCRAWRHRCADRWGWGTWQYRRCVRRHGC